jgi:hypothetical protein
VPGDVTLGLGGGDVGVGEIDPQARLHVTGGTDAEPGSGGVLVLGDVDAGNLALDGNELMARNNGAVSTLFLNNDGGDVRVGGTLDVGYVISESTGCSGNFAIAGCPVGTKIVTGGCTGSHLVQSHPSDGTLHGVGTTAWHCAWDDPCDSTNRAIAVCARVK